MLFYPSHDIALGNGVRHFNPPAAARQLQEDLAWLSEIWNNNNDNQNDNGNEIPLPWGWDWDTRNYLNKELGIKLKDLPTDQQLEAIRQLSSRRTTIGILQQLGFDDEMPCYLDTPEKLGQYIEDHDNASIPFVLKTPWSSSGRGLIHSLNTPRNLMLQRALSTLRKMGGIIGERWYNKTQDFAMLFKVTNEEVKFIGYSLFDNEESGTYRQGYLLNNEAIEQRLGSVVKGGVAELHETRQKLLPILNNLFAPFFHQPWQLGYIGIDMMVYRPDNLLTKQHNNTTPVVSIHPCIEMNVRCTMGVVCRLWSDNNLKPGEEGVFRISPMSADGHFEAQFELTK